MSWIVVLAALGVLLLVTAVVALVVIVVMLRVSTHGPRHDAANDERNFSTMTLEQRPAPLPLSASTAVYAPGREAQAPAQLATAFPQLEVLELLGKGGMGAVYKARQPHLDRFVALKVLPSETGAGSAERFSREARALARLSHPNIVAVYDFGRVAGLNYFIMEYVDGV